MSAAVPLHLYQIQWFLDRSRFKIGMFARQTGKTFTTTLEIADDCYEHESRGKRTRWVILSRGERQAKEAIEVLKLHCLAYGLGVDDLEYDWTVDKVSYKALEIVFANGSRVTALPANADTARGFSANVFLDEFAFHRDSREIWKALFPVVSAGFKLRVTSTPNGKNNKFYELMTADDGIWSRHTVDIHRACDDGLDRDRAALRAGLADEDAWSQEYELHWLDEASAWLPFDLIASVENDRAGYPEHYEGNACFLGNDIARRGHLWVAWVFELIGDVLWTREVAILKGATFAEQDAELDRIFAFYQVARACMDETGMGEKPVEDAIRRYGRHRVEGVKFTAASKLAMATLGKEALEDRRVRIPAGDVRLRADLHSLRKVASATGAPRFIASEDGAEIDSHADRAWACFLALNASDRPVSRIEHRATGRKRVFAGLSDYMRGG